MVIVIEKGVASKMIPIIFPMLPIKWFLFYGWSQQMHFVWRNIWSNKYIKNVFREHLHLNEVKQLSVDGFEVANISPRIFPMRQKNNYTPFANAITAADYGMQCDAATVIPLRYDMYAYLFNDNDEKQLFLWIHVYTTNKASNWRSALLLVCERNTQMTNEFRSQWSVMRSEMRKVFPRHVVVMHNDSLTITRFGWLSLFA